MTSRRLAIFESTDASRSSSFSISDIAASELRPGSRSTINSETVSVLDKTTVALLASERMGITETEIPITIASAGKRNFTSESLTGCVPTIR